MWRRLASRPPRVRFLTMLLCMCCVFNSAIAGIMADKNVTIKSENISVKDALNAVKKQTGMNIMYEDATLNNVPLKLTLEKVSLEQALSVICSQAGMRYELVENNYVLILPIDRNSKRKTITGIVRDELGEPVVGASVVVKGTTFGTIADMDGQFMLSFPENAGNKLMFSFIGMNTVEENMGNKRVFNVKLKSSTTNLDEVVVIGYGTAKPRDLTGAMARVSKEDIKSAPMTTNIQGMLQGKAAGVNVMIASASPTAPISVVIRGVSSLSGNGQPLWIIDGVPQYSNDVSGDVSNTLYNLNLNDVESLDVLKDASATAIYGSRAANGVVIVTTKTGAVGSKPTIELTTRYGFQSISSNDFRTMNVDQYIMYSKQINIDEAFRNGKLTYFNKRYIDENKFNTLNTSQWTKEDLAGMFKENAYYNGHDDYWDMMTQNAVVQEYNLSVRGGSQQSSYYASLNYKDQDGIVKGSNSRLLSARFNFETKVREALKFGLNMDASSREATDKDNMISKIIGIRPDYPAYNEDGSINTIDSYTKNPLLELKDKNDSQSRNLNASLFLEYNILPYLKFRTTGNIAYTNYKLDQFTRKYYDNGTNSATQENRQDYIMVWENLLTFYKTMGKHDVQAIAGYSMEKNWFDSMEANGSNFPDDDILTDLGSAATRGDIESEKETNALISAFARVQYKINNRYLLTATYRADGSSKFGKDNRWGYFPSIAAGWIASEESFMDFMKPALSYLKLRASYGLTGSQNLDNYDFASRFSSSSYNGQPGSSPSSLGNSLLQWESQAQTDLGIDFGFLNDRIRGGLGWYRKYVDNLIYDKPVPTSSAFDNISQNVGAISNTGIEFDIRGELIKTRDLTWEINFNIAHNKGKLEKLNGVTKSIGGTANEYFKLEEGGELGRFYGYVDAGRLFLNEEELWATKPIDPATGKVTYYRATTPEGAGDIYVMDLNGDGKITADGDRRYLGSSNPDFFGGFGTTFYWKGLMANLTFTYSVGGKRLWQQEISTCGGLNVFNAPTFVLDSWSMKGEEATYPFASHYGWGNNGVFTDRWLHNASYLRLSAINLSYRLPEKWFKRFLVKGIEATFQATNLFTVTPYPGMDPQGNFAVSRTQGVALSGFGTDYSTYPAARSFNFGLKFIFN